MSRLAMLLTVSTRRLDQRNSIEPYKGLSAKNDAFEKSLVIGGAPPTSAGTALLYVPTSLFL
ncbi:MAG: hypothetical protein ACFFEX_16165 [Candidatus Thorarchaeota archaeon]